MTLSTSTTLSTFEVRKYTPAWKEAGCFSVENCMASALLGIRSRAAKLPDVIKGIFKIADVTSFLRSDDYIDPPSCSRSSVYYHITGAIACLELRHNYDNDRHPPVRVLGEPFALDKALPILEDLLGVKLKETERQPVIN
jgi:hypothetical protein